MTGSPFGPYIYRHLRSLELLASRGSVCETNKQQPWNLIRPKSHSSWSRRTWPKSERGSRNNVQWFGSAEDCCLIIISKWPARLRKSIRLRPVATFATTEVLFIYYSQFIFSLCLPKSTHDTLSGLYANCNASSRARIASFHLAHPSTRASWYGIPPEFWPTGWRFVVN